MLVSRKDMLGSSSSSSGEPDLTLMHNLVLNDETSVDGNHEQLQHGLTLSFHENVTRIRTEVQRHPQGDGRLGTFGVTCNIAECRSEVKEVHNDCREMSKSKSSICSGGQKNLSCATISPVFCFGLFHEILFQRVLAIVFITF